MDSHIYQLDISPNRECICYVEITVDREVIIIQKVQNNDIIKKIYMDNVTALKWLNNEKVLIQSQGQLVIWDTSTDITSIIPILKDKIGALIDFSNSEIVYTTQMDIQVIEVKSYSMDTGVTNPLFSIDVIMNEQVIFDENLSKRRLKGYLKATYELMNNYEEKIFDKHQSNCLKIVNDRIETTILINDKKIIKKMGFIDRAFFTKEGIVLSYSNFFNPRQIYKINMINLGNNEMSYLNNEISNNHYLNYEMLHKYAGKRSVPITEVNKVNSSKKILIYLHGGPAASTRNEYLSFIKPVVERNYAICFMDYSGSTGYGVEYYERLNSNHGENALKDISSVIDYYRDEGIKDIYVLGESFGGYLAVMSSFRDCNKITKSISINGFTDYRYQYLFSLSRKIMSKYFNIKEKKNNPIDMLDETDEIAPLIFIHADQDLHCPIDQIHYFYNKAKLKKMPVKKQVVIRAAHYSMKLKINKQFDKELLVHLPY